MILRGDLGDVALPLVGLRMGETGLLPTTPIVFGDVGGRLVLMGEAARPVRMGETALFRGGDRFLCGDIAL